VILRSAQTDQILIDHSGVAKVAGFYRATVLPFSERTKTVNPLRSTKSRKDKNDEGDDVNPYSAPELLLGSLKHTKETDIWAIGTMMAHLLLGKPIFLGKERSALLLSMFKIVGSPAKDNYPDASKFPFAIKAPKKYRRGVEKAFERMMKEEDFAKHKKAIDLLAEMLHLDPIKRITAVEALNHEYMHDYYHHHETKSFRDQYVNDWMDMKKDLVHSSRAEKEDAQSADKTLKRKAMLQAAVGADDDVDDDLYDMDDLFDRSDSIGVLKKKAKI
jgi:serine/threonine protein kinase